MNRQGLGHRRVSTASRAAFQLAASIAFVSCGGGGPVSPTAAYNEHEWTQETRTLGGLDAVVLSMPASLRIEQGPDTTLRLDGERILLPSILTQVRDRTLEIRLEDAYPQHPGRLTELLLSTPALASVELADLGSIRGSGLVVDRLLLRLSDTGDLVFSNLEARQLEVMTGAAPGSVRLSGRIERQVVDLQGPADYQAGELRSSSARVLVSGSGSATVRVDDFLRVTIAGPGSVYYFGDPEIESEVTGSGRLVPLGR